MAYSKHFKLERLKYFVLILLIFLTACGFTPAYGPGALSKDMLENISFEDPDGRLEYEFLKAVERRIPQTPDPTYIVQYQITKRTQGGLTRDLPRLQIWARVNFDLIEAATNETLFSDSVDSFTSYTREDGLRGPAIKDAENRLMQILADKVVTKLIARSENIALGSP